MTIRKPTIAILHVSIYFLILYTAYNAFQNIITKIHEEEGDPSLGPFELSILFATTIIAQIWAPYLVEKFSPKYLITFCSLGNAFNYCMGFFMRGSTGLKYSLAGIGAVVNGISSAFIWVGIGRYVHNLCHHYHVQSQKGYYFGLFSAIYTWSTVIGAIILTFGLQLFNEHIYFLLTSLIAVLAFFYALFFVKNFIRTKKSTHHHVIKSETENPFLSEKDQSILTQADTVPLNQEASQSASTKQIKVLLKNICNYYIKMKYALPMILLDGINVGVTTSFMLHLLPSTNDEQKDHLNAGLCEIIFGIGATVGGYLGGRLCDALRIKYCCLVAIFTYFLGCLLSIFADLYSSLAFAMVCCLIWGFNVYYLQAAEYVMCSRLFEGKPESYAVVKQFHSFSMVIFFIVSAITHNDLPVKYVMSFLILFTFPAIFGVLRIPNQEDSQKLQSDGEVVSDQS